MKIKSIIILLILMTLTGLLIFTGCSQTTAAIKNEGIDQNDENLSNNAEETAVLGGGCFWSIEAIFEQLKGVQSAVAGYAGGTTENPAYLDVGSGNTGHAEVVKITFDPEIISFRQLLEVFFYVHDPTTPNRQGNDVGDQYRSIILFNSTQQENTAKEIIRELDEQKLYLNPIVTEVKPLVVFYPAEDYHQSYYQNNTIQPYCQLVIAPKVEKFQDKFADLIK